LTAFARDSANPLVRVRLDDRGGDPKMLVERALELRREAEQEARRLRDDNVEFDEVWCVFDVDQHERLAAAREQARANGIHVALSNPCFELWLLLHFRDHTAHLDGKKAISLLRSHVKGYHKHVDFLVFRDGYDSAVDRAKNLERRGQSAGSPDGNPSTSVYRLTERIREEGKQ
jgi:RloB-like protein